MREIKGFENYFVTERGEILNRAGKQLKQDINSSGYARVTLCVEGKTTRKFVHRLVAEAFVDNPHKLPIVNHIDGDRLNNAAHNLEWTTASENVKHGWRRGRRNPNRLDRYKEISILLAIELGFKLQDVAKMHSIHRDTVTQIKKREQRATTISKESSLEA